MLPSCATFKNINHKVLAADTQIVPLSLAEASKSLSFYRICFGVAFHSAKGSYLASLFNSQPQAD